MNRLDFSTLDRSILEDTINEANVSFEDSLIKSIGIEHDTSKDVSTLHTDVQKGKTKLRIFSRFRITHK